MNFDNISLSTLEKELEKKRDALSSHAKSLQEIVNKFDRDVNYRDFANSILDSKGWNSACDLLSWSYRDDDESRKLGDPPELIDAINEFVEYMDNNMSSLEISDMFDKEQL